MAINNPIDANLFRHFFLVRGVKKYIQEPNNFNQSNFKAVQDDIARDTFFGNEEAQLEFEVSFGAPCEPFINSDGVIISHLESGFEILNQENLNYGNEADVKYGLEKKSLPFTIGNIDFGTDYKTDGKTYAHCRVIQNTNQFLIKKREDIIIDLLATKDLDDNDITAIPIQRMFLKAKPTYGVSEWEHSEACTFQSYTSYFDSNPIGLPVWEIVTTKLACFSTNTVKDYGVENTLSNLDTEFGLGFNDFNPDSGVYIDAQEDLSNINISLRNLNIKAKSSYTSFGSSNPISGSGSAYLVVRYGVPTAPFSEITSIIVHQKDFIFENSADYTFPSSFDIPIDFVAKGKRIWVYVYATSTATFDNYLDLGAGIANYKIEGNMIAGKMTIEATQTAISSVINAVRWIDLIKQNYKAIGSLSVNAEKYDVGGEFYDNFCFNKNLIKQDLTKPFYLKLKDTKEQLLEQCAFAQVNDDEIYIGQYRDFYNNVDMGGFIEVPDYDSSIYKNPKYLVNKFVFGYEKYEQDRNERNTVDAIHTDSEWFPQAKNSINSKSFKLPFIRDPFITEVARKMVFSIKETSTTDDDNIFIADVTPLPPNARNKFTRLVSWQANGVEGTTKILSDNTFSWTQLGFNVGDTIIESGVSRVVLAMTPTLLTLSFVGGVANGTDFLTFDYPLTNVFYTNRTNEGLIFAENLRNSDNFGNLRYSIKRNMSHWFEVLATYGKFIPTKKIKNTYFKANGECKTQFAGETEPIKENADINVDDISEFKILSQDMYKTSVKCEFEKAVQLLKDIQNVRGFVRVQTPIGSVIKGYLKEGNNFWSDGILNLELEVKNESDFLTVTYSGGILTINEVGYTIKSTTEKIYNIFNDFIQFFDENNINLCNRTRYDKVSLNGVTFDNIDDLVNALELL